MRLIILLIIVFMINLYLYKIEKKSERDSKLELLRIVAIILIVSHHYALHGFEFKNLNFNINKLLLDFLILGGKVGVNLFIVISSYYLIDSKITLKKIINLILKVKIYAILFLLVFWSMGEIVTIKSIIRSLFPILYSLYWFVSAYIIFYMISPILNIALKNMEKNNIKKLIIISVLIYSIFSHSIGGRLFYSEIIWFSILYTIVYYIKIYIKTEVINNSILKYISILTYILLYLSVLVFEVMGKYNLIFKKYSTYFIAENSILSLTFSISIFLIFLKKTSFKSKFINYIATGTLGIYLVHENVFMRPFLYNNILNNSEYINKGVGIFLLHSLISIIFIFFFSLCVDIILNNVVYRILSLKISDKIEENINKIIKITNKSLEKYEK